MRVALETSISRGSFSSKQDSSLNFPLAYLVLGKSYQNTIKSSVVDHFKSLPSRLHIHDTDVQP